MKILACFIGLERTIDKTSENIKKYIINSEHEYKFIFVTWKSESSKKIELEFPNIEIFKVNDISDKDAEFLSWNSNLQMHISWIRRYGSNDIALFNYYRQIYLLKKTSEILENNFMNYDCVIRLRTDNIISGSYIYPYFKFINDNNIIFPNGPRHDILRNGQGCPTYIFIGKPIIVIKALKIIDYVQKYKISYVETSLGWFNVPTRQENIIQDESTFFLFLHGEGINITFMNNHIELSR